MNRNSQWQVPFLKHLHSKVKIRYWKSGFSMHDNYKCTLDHFPILETQILRIEETRTFRSLTPSRGEELRRHIVALCSTVHATIVPSFLNFNRFVSSMTELGLQLRPEAQRMAMLGFPERANLNRNSGLFVSHTQHSSLHRELTLFTFPRVVVLLCVFVATPPCVLWLDREMRLASLWLAGSKFSAFMPLPLQNPCRALKRNIQECGFAKRRSVI